MDGQEGELVVLKLGYNFSLSGVLRGHCASGSEEEWVILVLRCIFSLYGVLLGHCVGS